MKKSSFLNLLFITLLLGFVGATWYFRQSISDWIHLMGYTPPTEVVALADNTTMLDSSRRLFYVNRPLVAEKNEFNEHCRENEHTIVLGCFISGDGIYLLNVNDERLKGIKEVTAAHELLHAAYVRLDEDEREDVDAMVQSAFSKLNNDRITETVELYREQDASVVPNELHSILGTEVRNLPHELENYYERYFADRSKIVKLSEQYEQAFSERRSQIRAYDEQLAALKVKIDSLKSSLSQTDAQLKAQRESMNQACSSGDVDAYNAQVPVYNAKVNQFNADIDRLQSMIVQYNDIVKKRNDIASEEAELVEAIDSRESVPQAL